MNPGLPDSWVLQLVGGSRPRLPKYLKSYDPVGRGTTPDGANDFNCIIFTQHSNLSNKSELLLTLFIKYNYIPYG